MKNFFNKSKENKDIIKENFYKYIESNNITLEMYNNSSDFISYFTDATKNKNVDNLLAMKEIGFTLKNTDIANIHTALVNSSKNKNFNEYFEIILKMSDIKNKDMKKSHIYYEGHSFCLLSYLKSRNKDEHIDSLLKNGYPDVLQSSNNIITHFLSGNKFKEAAQIIKDGKMKLPPELIKNKLNYITIEKESEKEDCFYFIKEMLNDKELNNDFNVNLGLWSGLLLNDSVSLKEIQKNVHEFELFKNAGIWNKMFDIHFNSLLKINTGLSHCLNKSLSANYPDKLQFLEKNLSSENYKIILKDFIQYIILHIYNNESICEDLEKKYDIKPELLEIKENIRNRVSNGSLKIFDVYQKYHNDPDFFKSCLDKFVTSMVVETNMENKGEIRRNLNSKTMSNMIDTFANQESINKTFSSALSLDEFVQYEYSLFSLLIEYGDPKLVKKIMDLNKFDLYKNIEMYIINQMHFSLIRRNKTVAENKKDINEKLSLITDNKKYKDLKTPSLFVDNIDSDEDLSLAIKLMKADFESLVLVKSLTKTKNNSLKKRKRL